MSLSTNAGPQRGAASRSEKAKSPFHRTQPILGLIVDDRFGARPEALVLEYELPLSAESGHSGIGAPSLTKCLAELRDT
jgi:hypothetical protein